MLEKDLPDSVILKNVIEALLIKGADLVKALKFSSKSTVYMVLQGRNKLSDDFINRLILAYPNVSYLYLKRGKGTPLNTGASGINQRNILGISEQDTDVSLKEIMSIPERLDKIEANQELIMSLLGKIINKP